MLPAPIPQPEIYLQFQLHIDKSSQIRFVNSTSYLTNAFANGGYCFKHVGFDGKVLCELEHCMRYVKEYIVVSKQEVVILERDYANKASHLVLWNLSKNDYCKVTVKLLFQNGFGSSEGLLYFEDSEIVCYWHKSKHQKIQLTYYRLSELGSGTVLHQYLCTEFEEQGLDMKNRLLIAKFDQLSMVRFYYEKFSLAGQKMTVKYYDLDLQTKSGQLKVLSIDVGEILKPGDHVGNLYARMSDVWHISPDLLYVQIYGQKYFHSFREDFEQDFEQAQNQEEYWFQFYYNLQENKLKQKVKINSHYHRVQFTNMIRPVNYILHIRGKPYPLIVSDEPKTVLMPVYYIDQDREQIVMVNRPLKNNQEQKYEWLDYRSDKMFQVRRKKQYQEVVEVTVLKFPEWWFAYYSGLKTISVHWMSDFVQECCDDLVEMVYNLL